MYMHVGIHLTPPPPVRCNARSIFKQNKFRIPFS